VEIYQRKKPKFSLVTINPFFVIGPSHNSTLNESPKILADIFAGTYPAVLDLTWGIVDVRDVAAAHVLAMENPKAHGRYICVEHTMPMGDLTTFLQMKYPNISAKVPHKSMECGPGTSLMKVLANFQPSGVKDYLQTHLGKDLKVNNTKIKSELGINFTPVNKTLCDTVDDLIKHGHIAGAGAADAKKEKQN